jgi:hypothetical protein
MTSTATPRNLPAYDGEGNASQPKPTGFVTLDVDSHYFEITGARDAEPLSVQILTDATIAGVFTIEMSNAPGDVGPPDAATAYNEVSGVWIKEDPSTAYVASVGTGWSITNLTLTKTAGVGAAMIHLGNCGAKRVRVKAAITTGGDVRIMPNGKG